MKEVFSKIVDYIIDPEDDPDMVAKEVNSISGEYHLDIADGTNKVQFLWTLLANPANPFSEFQIGDQQSLANAVKDPNILRNYVKTHYVP